MSKLFTESIVLRASLLSLIARVLFCFDVGETTLTTTSIIAAKETEAKLQNINGDLFVTCTDFDRVSIFDNTKAKSFSFGVDSCF